MVGGQGRGRWRFKTEAAVALAAAAEATTRAAACCTATAIHNSDLDSVDTSSGISSSNVDGSSTVMPGCACLPGRLQAAAGLAGGEVDGRLHRAARLAHQDDLQRPAGGQQAASGGVPGSTPGRSPCTSARRGVLRASPPLDVSFGPAALLSAPTCRPPLPWRPPPQAQGLAWWASRH